MLDKAYVKWHKERLSDKEFKYLSAYDINKLEYEYLKFENDQYHLYGYQLAKYNGRYYFYELDKNSNNPNEEFIASFDNIDQVNGFLCGMYKAFHNRFKF